jgi:hypothetical protein
MIQAHDLARAFHEAYERLAPRYGYQTRKDSAVPWSEVPEPNKSLMVAVAQELIDQVVVCPAAATQEDA